MTTITPRTRREPPTRTHRRTRRRPLASRPARPRPVRSPPCHTLISPPNRPEDAPRPTRERPPPGAGPRADTARGAGRPAGRRGPGAPAAAAGHRHHPRLPRRAPRRRLRRAARRPLPRRRLRRPGRRASAPPPSSPTRRAPSAPPPPACRCWSWTTRAAGWASWPPRSTASPGRDLLQIGITGTSGKTTTAYLVEGGLRARARRASHRAHRHRRDRGSATSASSPSAPPPRPPTSRRCSR